MKIKWQSKTFYFAILGERESNESSQSTAWRGNSNTINITHSTLWLCSVAWRSSGVNNNITSAWFNFSIPFKYRKINEPARKIQGNGAEVSFFRFLSIKMKKPTERATKRMNLPQLPHIAVMSRQIAGKWVRWLCGVGLNYMRLIIKKCHIMQKKSTYNQVTSHDLKTIRLARSQSWHCKYFYIFPCNSRVSTIPARVRDRSLSVIINIYHT